MEELYNGIRLPEVWPPRNMDDMSLSELPVPYLENRPDVALIDVGRHLFVDDFLIEENWLEKRFHQAVLDEIYSPIGLNIGAETPEEIGVAIIAEIIEVKNKKKRTYGYSKEIRKAIENDTDYGQKVLATIIDRKGSAPQGVGVKMLICENGTCVGTIGGGCMEAGVVQKARLLMSKARTLTTTQPQSGKDETDTASICSVDLQNADAGEEGMVCGGSVKVLLELLEE